MEEELLEKTEVVTDSDGKQYEVTLVESERIEIAVYKQACNAIEEQLIDIVDNPGELSITIANWLQAKGLLKE